MSITESLLDTKDYSNKLLTYKGEEEVCMKHLVYARHYFSIAHT